MGGGGGGGAQLHVRMWKDGGMMGKANIWECERIWGDKDLGKYEEWVMESKSEGVKCMCGEFNVGRMIKC